MSLCYKAICETVNKMDHSYDANFGDWIRNEDNARIIGYHLAQYVEEYSTEDIVTVMKWIVKDWTLKSIILLTRKMIIEEHTGIDSNRHRYTKRIEITRGLIDTWNPIFISEFIVSITRTHTLDEKCKFVAALLKGFEIEKIKDVIYQVEAKMEPQVRNSILKTLSVNKKRVKKKTQLDKLQ